MTNGRSYCLTREKERMDLNIQTEEKRKYLVSCARLRCGRGQFLLLRRHLHVLAARSYWLWDCETASLLNRQEPYGGTCCLLLQGALRSSALKAEAEGFLKGVFFGSRLRAMTFSMAVIFGGREGGCVCVSEWVRERERVSAWVSSCIHTHNYQISKWWVLDTA
jgi:hypothetical protein